MKKNHPRGAAKNDFCGVPGTPCNCANDYVKICEPPWAHVTFKQKGKAGAYDKKYEAHHILCVACVESALVSNSKIDESVRETKWCINKKLNMIAMPVWGHTVRWYKDQGTSVPPGFVNIPQHNWEHNGEIGYTKEVEGDLRELACDIEEQQCEAAAVDLAKDLDSLINDKWAPEISRRGNRAGAWGAGTHDGWQAGVNGHSDWYKPFSMANDGNMSHKKFPLRNFGEEEQKMLDRMAAALRGGS